MEHQIDGTHLLSKKVSRKRFRASIFEAWHHTCAYCGAYATTIDHVRPKVRGGTTELRNCVPACLGCNSSKAHTPVWIWWTRQPYWDLARARLLYDWLTTASFPSYAQCIAVPAISRLSIEQSHN